MATFRYQWIAPEGQHKVFETVTPKGQHLRIWQQASGHWGTSIDDVAHPGDGAEYPYITSAIHAVETAADNTGENHG